jgi:hypothetical protein
VSTKSTVDEIAEAMMKVQILKCFVRAHMRSQEKLVRYFGFHGQVDRPEVARIILQSEISVFKAICLCEKHKQKLPEVWVAEVRAAEIGKATTQLCEEFLISAHHNGVLNHVEADSMLEPLHHYLSKVTQDLKDFHSGRIDLDQLKEHAKQDQEEGTEAKYEEELHAQHIQENEYAMNDDAHFVQSDTSDSDDVEEPDTPGSGSYRGCATADSAGFAPDDAPGPVVLGKEDTSEQILNFQEPAQEPPPESDNDGEVADPKPKTKRKMKTKTMKKVSMEIGAIEQQGAQDDGGPQVLK